MKKPVNYDVQMVNKAGTTLTLRVVVSAYLVYLAWKILSASFSGESPIPSLASWGVFLLFVGAALYFSIHSLREFLRVKKAAVFPENPSVTDESREETEPED